jgi:predicted DNA-binding transcriptional regulator YafY
LSPLTNLHRRLSLIRRAKSPYTFPSKKELLEQLKATGFLAIGQRTLERDMQQLREEYGIDIKYSTQRNGYYLYIPPDEDVDDFNQFVSLLERKERLDFLQSTLTNVQDVGSYLQLERTEQFNGSELLPLLWDALRGQRSIRFSYASYTETNSLPLVRTIEPGIIFEYRNRWYLDGWDVEKNGIRTFGLDRMSNLTLAEKAIATNRTDAYKFLRKQVIGVTTPNDANAERVLLRFSNLEANYIISLPMHSSQKVLQNTTSGVEIELFVVLNHELEREILAYGEAVEVLEPLVLRERIRERVRATHKIYKNRI